MTKELFFERKREVYSAESSRLTARTIKVLETPERLPLYTGVTGNLVKRVYEHKNNSADGFTQKYALHDLLYYEIFKDPQSAIERGKQIKSWSGKLPISSL